MKAWLGEHINFVRVTDRDLWNVDHTLAKVIVPVLKRFRALYDTKGCVIGYAMPADCEEANAGRECAHDHCAEWVQVLDKMIWSFEQLAGEEGAWYGWSWNATRFRRQCAPEEDTRTREWMAKRVTHVKRIQEGVDLFAKHYADLWW